MPMGFELARPLILLALPLAFFYGLYRRRSLRAGALRFGPLQYRRPAGWRGGLLTALLVVETLVVALVVVGLAGPRRVDTFDSIREDGLDVALVLDLSASMQAEDFEPTRLAALRELAADFVRRRGPDRIAVFAFAKHVFTHSPMTTDHAVLAQLIEGLTYDAIDHVKSGGTALGDALIAAADGLLAERIEDRDQVLVLITDGQSNHGIDPLLAARFVAESDIRLHVVGIGGEEPVPVSVRGEPFITVDDTQLVTSLDDSQLEEIAEAAGGTYQRATSRGVLAAIFDDLARLETTPLEITTVAVATPWTPRLAVLLFAVFAAWLLADALLARRPLR